MTCDPEPLGADCDDAVVLPFPAIGASTPDLIRLADVIELHPVTTEGWAS